MADFVTVDVICIVVEIVVSFSLEALLESDDPAAELPEAADEVMTPLEELLGTNDPIAGAVPLTALVLAPPPTVPPPTIISSSLSSSHTTLVTNPGSFPTSKSKLPSCAMKVPALTSRDRTTSLFDVAKATATRSPARLMANDRGPMPPAENFWSSVGLPVVGSRENVTMVSDGEFGLISPGGLSLSSREEMIRNLISGYLVVSTCHQTPIFRKCSRRLGSYLQ